MDEVRALAQQAGLVGVRTYIQSGNLVFSAGSGTVALEDTLSGALADRFGFEVPIVVFTADELRAAFAAQPFGPGVDVEQLHVGFLRRAAPAAAWAALDRQRSPPDAVAGSQRTLYLHLPNGVARTKYTSAYLDRALGTTVTVRNWRTVAALVELLG
jgi:uncharacterized protein (DUF1697 family)